MANLHKLLTSALFSFCLSIVAHASEAGAGKSSHRDNKALFPTPMANLDKSKMPEKVKLLTPAFASAISGASTELKWNATSGQNSYHVQVAKDPNFKWLLVDTPLYKSTSLAVSGLEPGMHYYWRVAATAEGNWPSTLKGPFSVSMFQTK